MDAAILNGVARTAPGTRAHSLADLEPVALEATRAAALACQPWIGAGNGKAADEAATEAMRAALAHASRLGTVVVGKGARTRRQCSSTRAAGRGGRHGFDIAVDPLECTTLCAKALAGSLATMAFAAPG